MRPRPRRRRVRAAALPVVLLLGLLGLGSGASGDPAPGQDELPQTSTAAGGLGRVTASQIAAVARSKMFISIGPEQPVWAVLYATLFNTPPENPTSYVALCSPRRGTPCLPDPFYQPPCADPAVLTTMRRGLYFKSLLYPVTPLQPLGEAGADVGRIASVRVRLPAFGAIPSEVTVTLRTVREGGRVQPLVAHVWNNSTAAASCDPGYVAPAASTLVEGRIEIQLSDLTVDGVPVDLGDRCRTSRPALLQLWGENERGDYTPLAGGPLGAFDGLHPGTIRPLDSPYYGADDGRTIPASSGLTIPPFTGCGSAGEDLSPLMSAMASGPDNPVRLAQGTLVSSDDPGFQDLNKLAETNSFGLNALPAPALPERPPVPDGR